MLSIKRIFVLTAALSTLLVAGIGARVVAFRSSVEDSDASSAQRYQSHLLANELRQSSEDLTRLARTFVVTGDARYETEYFHIVDVRNGKSPRPDGRTVALTTLMRELGFTDVELGKLDQAQASSNGLVRTETIAMNAAKGLYDDGTGQYSRRGEPDFELARRLMHDNAYHATKLEIMRPIDEFFSLLDQRTSQAVAESQDKRNAILTSILVLVVATLGSLGAALFAAYRWIIGKLGGEPTEALAIATDIAAGKLDTPIRLREGDTTSVLASMRTMRDRLLAIVSQIRGAAYAIDTASGEMAAGNQDLASRTETQAANVEETAAAIEELTGTVRQNADNAGQANRLVMSASDVASKGGKVVAEVVRTMGSIAESSKKISEIIGVIDGLAFQTNILALNAAVEAARAGEQGQGFAVVAAEVRTLSQRSAEAAKAIKVLIDDSVGKVEAGSVLVGDAGRTMEEVVGSVKRVTDIMGEIAAATHEQSSGLEQVNRAIVQIDQGTQQNASLVEQATAAAEAMRDQASSLTDAVSVFVIGDDAHPYASASDASHAEARAVSRARGRSRARGARPGAKAA